MDNKEQPNKAGVTIRTILTFVVLFILPLGSLYFLSSGVDYRKTAINELEDKGKVADFVLYNQNNIPVSPGMLRSKVAVVHFLSDDNVKARQQADRIAKVHQSFDNTDDVCFLSFLAADSSVNLIDKAKALGITDNEQWFLIRTKKDDWKNLSENVFKIPDLDEGVALIDTSMTIRKHYDIQSNPDMGRLVEHISIVIPKQKRR